MKTALGTASFLAIAALLAASTPCAAQECGGGRVRTDDRCCWPGQTWSARERMCAGVPECPVGTDEEGETCVPRPEPTALPTLAPTPALTTITGASGGSLLVTATSTEAWPSLRRERPAGIVNPVVRHATDIGLLVAGLSTFGTGYLVGILGGVGDESGENCRTGYWSSSSSREARCGTWPFGFVPFVGGIVAGTTGDYRRAHGWGIGFGVPSLLLQLVGGVITIFALANYTVEVESLAVDLGESARLEILPSAAASETGVTVRVTL